MIDEFRHAQRPYEVPSLITCNPSCSFPSIGQFRPDGPDKIPGNLRLRKDVFHAQQFRWTCLLFVADEDGKILLAARWQPQLSAMVSPAGTPWSPFGG